MLFGGKDCPVPLGVLSQKTMPPTMKPSMKHVRPRVRRGRLRMADIMR